MTSLKRKLDANPGLVGIDLVKDVTCHTRYAWTESTYDISKLGYSPAPSGSRFRVAAFDFGIKRNILRLLVRHGCDVTVVPAATSADEIVTMKPDGIFLSNGPGDPAAVTYAIDNVRTLGKSGIPIFGICLGHQILGLAFGGKSFKLKFGHRGANHPVKDLKTNRILITSQNHGFAIDPESLPPNQVEITQINLNDHTLEGLAHRHYPVFSVQYHPEASPGPHDSEYLFQNFIDLMKRARS